MDNNTLKNITDFLEKKENKISSKVLKFRIKNAPPIDKIKFTSKIKNGQPF
jgi:hypothetical protein